MTTVMAKRGNPNPKTSHLERYRFQPGASGNPGGLPKGTSVYELKMLARTSMPIAIERLNQLIKSENEAIALQAIQFAYLYAFGKPQEGTDVAHQDARQARSTELVAVPVNEPALELPEKAADAVVTPEQVLPTLPPESTEATDSPTTAGKPVSAPSGLHCLYRNKTGVQCTETVAAGEQWCQPHKDRLFAAMGES